MRWKKSIFRPFFQALIDGDVHDFSVKEDACRIRVDDRAESFSRIRQACLNLLKGEKSFKGGITRKRMMCAMDENYLSKVLGSVA
ncbi:transposase [Vibrio sp. TH_r3]|uniref:transposase n=1 Tax=Vibrio sp. TH_r3 TaxID=3082084 RepID=UPI003985928B